MIQLYANISHLIQTEQEFMANRSKELNEWTRKAMKKYRQQIAVNGIYDQLKINPLGDIADGNARLIIARENFDHLMNRDGMYYAGSDYEELARWGYLPIDLGWLLGIQVFPHSKTITIRTDLLEYFTHPLDKKRSVESLNNPNKTPFVPADPSLPVEGFTDISVFSLTKRIYKE